MKYLLMASSLALLGCVTVKPEPTTIGTLEGAGLELCLVVPLIGVEGEDGKVQPYIDCRDLQSKAPCYAEVGDDGALEVSCLLITEEMKPAPELQHDPDAVK